MFSDHLSPPASSRTRQWLILGAAAVMISQLVALAWLAGGQVDKATTRAALEVAERVRMADCIEKSSGATRYLCNRQDSVEVLAGQTANGAVNPVHSARDSSVLGGLMPATSHRGSYSASSFAPTVLSKN